MSARKWLVWLSIVAFSAASTIALGALTESLWSGARGSQGEPRPTATATAGESPTATAAPRPAVTVTVTATPVVAQPTDDTSAWVALAALGTAVGGLGTVAAGVAALLALRRTREH